MSNKTNDHQMPCADCGTPMFGIGSYEVRQLCESCGGNDTEFNAENPNPENFEVKNGR